MREALLSLTPAWASAADLAAASPIMLEEPEAFPLEVFPPEAPWVSRSLWRMAPVYRSISYWYSVEPARNSTS